MDSDLDLSFNNEKKDITFIDIQKYLKKSFPIIVCFIVACCLLVNMIGLIYSLAIKPKDTAYGSVNLVYSGIEKGLAPDGTIYDATEINSIAIIGQALINLNLDTEFSPSDINNAIIVEGIIPNSEKEKINLLKEKDTLTLEELDAISYQPTTFSLMLSTENVKNLSRNQAIAILDEIMKVYLSNFKNKYMTYSNLPSQALTVSEFSSLDFAEAIDYIKNINYSISSYLSIMQIKEPNFVTKNGNTFSSLYSKAELLSSQLDAVSSQIINNSIVKEKTTTLSYLKYKLAQIDISLSTKQTTINNIKEFLANYAKQYPDITISGTNGNSVLIPQSAAYDEMFTSQQVLTNEIADLTIQKDFYESWVTILEPNVDVASSAEDIAKIDNQLSVVLASLSSLTDVVNNTSESYNSQKLSSYIQISSSAIAVSTAKSFPWLYSNLFAIIVGIILGLVCYTPIAKCYHKKTAKKS